MAKHVHTWQRTCDLMLTLPDAQSWHDRLITFACTTCPEESVMTASHHRDSPVLTPEQAAAHAATGRNTPEGRIAAQQQRHRLIKGLR